MALSFVAASAWVSSGTAVTPGVPAGTAAGDFVVITIVSKYEDASLGNAPTGWTDIAPAVNTTGRTAGNDNGNLRIRAFWKIWQTGDTMPSLAPTPNNVSTTKAASYRVAAGKTFDIQGELAADSTVGSPLLLVASSTLGLRSGDIFHTNMVLNGDVVTWGATSLASATGATMGAAAVNTVDASTTTGTDLRMRSNRFTVNSGTATGNAQVSTNLGGTTTNAVGVGLLLRIREIDIPSVTGTIAETEENDTLAASGTSTAPSFTGTLVWTETSDVVAASGTATAPNTPPVAVAIATPDPVTDNLSVITLDGTSSYDPDGTIASYLWEQVSGPAGTIANSAAAYTTFTPGAGWMPIDLAGLQQWVRADALSLSDGDPVSTWPDDSGNSRDFTQATSGARPTFRTNIVNGLPVVRSDGTTDRMVSALPMTNTDDFTLFAVGALTNTSTYRAVYAVGDNAANGYAIMGRPNVSAHAFLRGGLAWHESATAHSFTPAVQILRRSGGVWKLYLNGGSPLITLVANAPNAPTTRATLFSHDNTDGNSAGADLVECGCYSAALTDGDVNTLGDYLADRIGTTWTAIS